MILQPERRRRFNLEVPAGTFDSFASQIPENVQPAGAKGHWRERKAGQPFLALFFELK